MKIHRYVCLTLVLLLTAQEASGQLVGFRTWRIQSEPSNIDSGLQNVAKRGWLCFNIRSGGLSTDCPVTFELFESSMPFSVNGILNECQFDALGRLQPLTCAHGGHLHDDPKRPTLYPGTEVRYPNGTNTTPLKIENAFSPGDLDTLFEWTLPQVGGYFEFQSTMEASGNSKFVTLSNGILTLVDKLQANGLVDVTYARNSLRQLPDDDSVCYRKARGGTATHRSEVAYAATELTIAALRAIGRNYEKTNSSLISYNDISLPKGGIFEAFVNQTMWQNPHTSHRMGTEIDINRLRDANNNPIRCDMELTIENAINSILSRRTPAKSALLCETQATGFPTDPGTYHLIVTNLLSITSAFSFAFCPQ